MSGHKRRIALIIDRGSVPPFFLEKSGAMVSRVSGVVGALAESDDERLNEAMKEMAARSPALMFVVCDAEVFFAGQKEGGEPILSSL